MKQGTVLQKKTARKDVRTEQLPAQEKLDIDAQDASQVSADQVYAQRLSETLPDGSLSAPTYIP